MPKKSKEISEESNSQTNGIDAENELYNFPSIGRLFADGESGRLEKLRSGYEKATLDLDVIIRKGSDSEARSASKAQRAIIVTLDFLDSLKNQKSS